MTSTSFMYYLRVSKAIFCCLHHCLVYQPEALEMDFFPGGEMEGMLLKNSYLNETELLLIPSSILSLKTSTTNNA